MVSLNQAAYAQIGVPEEKPSGLASCLNRIANLAAAFQENADRLNGIANQVGGHDVPTSTGKMASAQQPQPDNMLFKARQIETALAEACDQQRYSMNRIDQSFS